MNANETVTSAFRDCLVTSDAQRLHLERWTHRVRRWHSSSVPEGDITYLAKLPASTYIKPIPALQIIRTIIPLCGFGHTEEWKWLPTSERRITRDGDPMHTPTLASIIVERAVLGAAVVPDRSEPTSQRNRQVNSGCTACVIRKSRIGRASARLNPSSVCV